MIWLSLVINRYRMCNIQHRSGTMDTILTVFDACPDAGGVEMACNDDYASSVYTSEIQYDDR